MPDQIRQLAAIMFTDIVGYTALMGKDSAKALELIRISKEIQKPLVEKHNGKWLKEMGDGALAQFSSAIDAVNCSIEIQKLARGELDAKLRIGIHLGDVTVEENDVHGDGVNVAARLESIADPGGIYISESIEKAIQGQSDIQAKYLGEIKLKNVAYSVRTYAVQGVGLPVPDFHDKKELSGHLWAEMERRGVIRASLIYILISLLLILIIPLVQSSINFPEWFRNALITTLGIGFPIAIFLAWRYERSPEGFVRATSKESWGNPFNASMRKPLTGNVVLGSLLIAILILFIYPKITPDLKSKENTKDVPSTDKSIAILPFANMSNDPEQEYFSDGMSEEIINKLSQIEDLRVIARTSAFAFKGKDEDMREIGRKLNVAHLLEGSVRKAGNRIRITAQLISVNDGSHLWSQSYDREMEDANTIFAIQDEISLSIVDHLKVNLLGKEKTAIVKRYTEDFEAYNLYLKGRNSAQMITTEALEKAIEYYKQSLQIDPNYPPAYAGLAVAYGYMSYWGNIPPKEAYPIAKEYVKKALELDNTLAIGHVSLGFINMVYDYDYKAAEQELKLGLHLNPSSAIGHMYYSFYLTLTENHNEAIKEAKLAVELDPLSNYYNAQLGQSYNYAGQYDRAITELQKTISMFPNYFLPHFHIGGAYSAKSMFQEAIRHYEQAVDFSGGNHVAVSALAFAYFGNGELEKGEKLFESLELRSKNEYIPKFIFALYNASKGNIDLAFELWERAIDEHDSFVPWINISPEAKLYIKNDPRYMELMAKAGFLK